MAKEVSCADTDTLKLKSANTPLFRSCLKGLSNVQHLFTLQIGQSIKKIYPWKDFVGQLWLFYHSFMCEAKVDEKLAHTMTPISTDSSLLNFSMDCPFNSH